MLDDNNDKDPFEGAITDNDANSNEEKEPNQDEKKKGERSTIENKGSIEKQAYHLGSGDLHIHEHYAKKDDSNDFTNLIEQNRPSDLEAFFHEHFEQKRKKLWDNKVIIIDCREKEVAQSLMYRFKSSLKEDYELRELSLDSEVSEDEMPTFRSLFLQNGFRNKKGGVICLVRIDAAYSRNFFKGFLEKSKTSVRENLRNNKTLAIFSIEYYDEKNSIQANVNNSEFKDLYWKINFLDYLLSKHIKHKEEINTYKKKLLLQRKEGSWSPNENLFYKSLINLFHKGTAEFYKAVDSKIQIEGELTPAEKEQQKIKEITKGLRKLIKKESKTLHKDVIYTAAFFPDLKLSEFKTLVGKIVAQKTFKVKEKIKKKKKKTIKQEVEKSCLIEWKDHTDKILRECHLTATYIDDTAKQVIDFTRLEIRNEMQNLFSNDYPSYLQDKFSFLMKSGILFDPATTSNIVEGLTQLAVRMAINDPEENGNTVLYSFASEARDGENSLVLFSQKMQENNQIMTAIERQIIIEAITSGKKIDATHIDTKDLQQRDELNRKLTLVNKYVRNMHYTLMSRFSAVINEMLNHASLRTLVQSFFSNLFYQKDYITIYRIIELGRITNTEFDELNLVKKLLNNTPKEHPIRMDIYNHLLKKVNRSEDNTFELLSEIYSWLQENAESLLFLPQYAIYEFSKLSNENFKLTYPLFYENVSAQQISDSSGHVPLFKDKLSFYLDWLYHEKIKNVPYVTRYYNLPTSLEEGPIQVLPRLKFFTEKLKEPKTRKNYLLNEIGADHIVGKEDLIEKWFMILNEIQADVIKPDANVLLQALSVILLNIEDKQERRAELQKLRDYWKEKKQFYVALLNATDNRPLQAKIKLRRKILFKLLEGFRHIITNSKV